MAWNNPWQRTRRGFSTETLSFDTANSFTIDANTAGVTTRTLTLTGGTNALGGTDVISLSNATTGTISMGVTAGVGTLNLALAAGSNVAVTNAAANLILGANSVVSGTTISKSGLGTLTLGGVNTYTGLTTVSDGTLKITDTSALGTSAAGTTVASGATLDIINSTGILRLGTQGGILLAAGAGSLTIGNVANRSRLFEPVKVKLPFQFCA